MGRSPGATPARSHDDSSSGPSSCPSSSSAPSQVAASSLLSLGIPASPTQIPTGSILRRTLSLGGLCDLSLTGSSFDKQAREKGILSSASRIFNTMQERSGGCGDLVGLGGEPRGSPGGLSVMQWQWYSPLGSQPAVRCHDQQGLQRPRRRLACALRYLALACAIVATGRQSHIN